MKITANEIKPGMIIEHKNDLWNVLKTQHVKPGKGGAFNQVELKSVVKGTKLNERFRSNENVEKAEVDEKKFNFLYSDDKISYFMDNITFEQVSVLNEIIGDKVKLLKENLEVTISMLEEKPLSIELPKNINCVVESTDAVVKGQTAASSYKPAKLDNGLTITVPPFIENGDKIIIDSRNLEYVKKTIKMRISSPKLNIMYKACMKASKSLIRDFGEIENLQVSSKGPGDFVSSADKRTEKIIIDELMKAYPHYGILSEEVGKINEKNKDNRWIIDPIDGTSNFLNGIPQFAISIGYEENQEIKNGLIYDPIKNELFFAELGNGAFLNNSRIRVSKKKN